MSRSDADNSARLREVGADLGVLLDFSVAPLSRNKNVQSFQSPSDTQNAEEYLAFLRKKAAEEKPPAKGLKRMATKSSKATVYTHDEVYTALSTIIEENGSAGVLEVLLKRFDNLKGDINVARKAKTGVFRKLAKVDSAHERGNLLHSATEQQRNDFMQLLVPLADPLSRNECLQIALSSRDIPVIETLLRYDADMSLYKADFDKAATSGDADLLETLIRARRKVSKGCITRNLMSATINGSKRCVMLLALAGADCDADGAPAFINAVSNDRADLVVAMLLGEQPPHKTTVDKAITMLMSGIKDPARLSFYQQLLEILLCAGPTGNAVNEALVQATQMSNINILEMLLSHNADIDFDDAAALANAIKRNRIDLVKVLLANRTLARGNAVVLVPCISVEAIGSDRIAIVNMLLHQGASGEYCSQLLIMAVEQDDMDMAELLVCFERGDNQRVCSVDYKLAACLHSAVSKNDTNMIGLLVWYGGPSKASLAKAIESIPPNLKRDELYVLLHALLQGGAKGGAEGLEVTEKLHSIVTGHYCSAPLVELFMKYKALIAAKTIFAAVSQGDASILAILLKGGVSAATCTSAIPLAMKIQAAGTRLQITKLLNGTVPTGPSDVKEVSQALIDVLRSSPDDTSMLNHLCGEGRADVDFQEGLAVNLATSLGDPDILDIVLQNRKASSTTIERSIRTAIELPPTNPHRSRKLAALLQIAKPQPAVNAVLVKELETVKEISVIKLLLAAGADVNFEQAKPLLLSIRQPAIMDLLLAKKPTKTSLSTVFMEAIHLQGAFRHTLCEKFLRAGAEGDEINKGLCAVEKEGLPALGLMRLLLSKADVNFSKGKVVRGAVKHGYFEGLDLLLDATNVKLSIANRTATFLECLKLSDIGDQLKFARRVLESGVVVQNDISDSLITAVDAGNYNLVELLLQHGASLEHKNHSAVCAAARTGKNKILTLLVSGKDSAKPTLSTLTAAFESANATKLQGMEEYFSVAQILLEAGMKGNPVNLALVDSVKRGDASLELSELLCKHSASADWNNGEPLSLACESASIATINFLLVCKPRKESFTTAWTAATGIGRDDRVKVLALLLKAGKAIDNQVTDTFTAVTKEKTSDRDLIKLFLTYEIFDQGEAMIHTARVLDLKTFSILLASPKSKPVISTVFKEATDTDVLWRSASGLTIFRHLLEKEASGDALADALLHTIENWQDLPENPSSIYLDLLLRSNVDVNYKSGLALQRAASQVNIHLLTRLLPLANSYSKSIAFPYIFTTPPAAKIVMEAIELFIKDGSEADEALEVIFQHPNVELEPILFMALDKFPCNIQMLNTLLDYGYPPNQWRLTKDDSRQTWPILCWALSQEQKKISNACIEILLDRGANPHFKAQFGITPLFIAIRNQRPDIVSALIAKEVNVIEPDADGITPLALSCAIGNIPIMDSLLSARADTDDGSLHDASRELRTEVIRTLLKHDHDINCPSDRHEGRTPLAELCLYAVSTTPTPSPAKLREVIECLIANGADFQRHDYLGKSIFHHALASEDPMLILPVMLKIMWKQINEPAFLFKDKTYTYSLTMYVEKGLSPNISLGPQKDAILHLLRIQTVKDRYWATSITATQPPDCIDPPPEIYQELIRQQVWEREQARTREQIRIQIENEKQMMQGHMQVQREKTAAELALAKRKAQADLALITNSANQTLALEMQREGERDRVLAQRQLKELSHQRESGDILIATQRGLRGEDAARAREQLEYVQSRARVENEGVRSRLAIENAGAGERDRVQKAAHDREMVRLRLRDQLVEKQTVLAGTLAASSGLDRRQIGYVISGDD